MALDSMYKIREVNKPTEVKPQQDIKDMKRLIDSLPTLDMDQKWVKDNESKENHFNTPSSKTEDEQTIDDMLANFKRIRESNNNMRAQLRKQQLSPLQQLEDLQRQIDGLTGGKSR